MHHKRFVMVELGNKYILNNIFPNWYFPLYNFIGYLPLKPNKAGCFTFSFAAAFRSLVTVIGNAAYVSFALLSSTSINMGSGLTGIINTISVINLLAELAIYSVVTILQCWFKKFDAVVGKLIAFEKFWMLKTGKKKREGDLVNKLSIVMIILLVLFILPANSYSNWELENSMPYFMISLYICQLHFLLMEIMFLRIAMSLAGSFEKLNKLVKYCCLHYVEDHCRRVQVVTFNSLRKEVPRVTVEEIREIHGMLCKTVEEVNSFFGVQMLFIIIHLFFHVVVNPYFTVAPFLRGTIKNNLLYAVIHIVWTLYSLFQLIYLAWVSSLTPYHGNKTSYHVSCLLTLDLPPMTRKEVKYTLEQMNVSKVHFSVLNLFNIDLPLISSIMEMAFSYFVLVIQYERTTLNNK